MIENPWFRASPPQGLLVTAAFPTEKTNESLRFITDNILHSFLSFGVMANVALHAERPQVSPLAASPGRAGKVPGLKFWGVVASQCLKVWEAAFSVDDDDEILYIKQKFDSVQGNFFYLYSTQTHTCTPQTFIRATLPCSCSSCCIFLRCPLQEWRQRKWQPVTFSSLLCL